MIYLVHIHCACSKGDNGLDSSIAHQIVFHPIFSPSKIIGGDRIPCDQISSMAHCRLPLVDPWTLGPHSTWSTCVFSYINILWIKVSLNVYGSVTYRLAKIRYTQPLKRFFK